MGLFSQEIYIPEAIYKLLPLLYALVGLFMLLVLQNDMAQIAGAALMVFALVITVKRFRQPDNG
ncbi:hypothetical protein G4Y73_12400 [Wenzhouxiangella sp. XN201]|nr:hypothetical protein [Wenzhouxiangella sp. XN201]